MILSQLHSFVGTLQVHKHPRLDQTPAYHKLLEGRAATDLSKDVLEEAKDEIWQIQQMLVS